MQLTATLDDSALGYVRARGEFQRLHRRARLRTLIDRLLGRPSELRALGDLRVESPARGGGVRRLTQVCLDRVLGSVDRAHDYTRGFLPRLGGDEDRWARIRLAIEGDQGVPPLELLEVDGTYYVRDGHHRVSVLKHLGVRSFEAYVTRLDR